MSVKTKPKTFFCGKSIYFSHFFQSKKKIKRSNSWLFRKNKKFKLYFKKLSSNLFLNKKFLNFFFKKQKKKIIRLQSLISRYTHINKINSYPSFIQRFVVWRFPFKFVFRKFKRRPVLFCNSWKNLFLSHYHISCKINFFFSKKKKSIRFLCECLWLKLIKKKLENIFYNVFNIYCFFSLKNIVYKKYFLSHITKLVFLKIPAFYKNFNNLLTIVRILNYSTFFFNTYFLISLIVLEMSRLRFHRKFIYMLFSIISLLQLHGNSKYLGIQIGLIGKINGRRRKNSFYLYRGIGCFHKLSLKLDFCQKHMFTRFGVFNLKAWIFFK